MILLALDVGEKRIGVAKSDELGIFAHPVGFIARKSDRHAIAEVSKLVIEWNPEKIVVGLPKEMSGKIGKAAEKVMEFGAAVQAAIPGTAIEYWDERLSTKGAERVLIDSDVSRKKRRSVIDKMAAQAILQNYIDANKNRFPAC